MDNVLALKWLLIRNAYTPLMKANYRKTKVKHHKLIVLGLMVVFTSGNYIVPVKNVVIEF